MSTGEPPAVKRKWSEALTCTTRENFLSTVASISPRDYILNQEKVEYFAAKLFKPAIPVYTPTFTEFTVPQELADWVEQRTQVCVRSTTTICRVGAPQPGRLSTAAGPCPLNRGGSRDFTLG